MTVRGTVATYTGALLVVLVCLFPFLWMLVSSVKELRELYTIPPTWIPDAPTLGNYATVLFESNIPRYFLNSVVISVGSTGLALILAIFASYGFARFQFRGKTYYQSFILVGQLLPTAAIIVPLFVTLRYLDLVNTYLGLILVYMIVTLPHVGISTVGRSAKFAQQAVAASLLQAATDQTLPADTRDGYWTLVNYFNSLRELGGALVLMRDDVARSIRDYAARRPDEAERDAGMQIELTSRVRSSDIPKHLKDLERAWSDPDHVDIVLASNMISVGMDVSRLGLMVVNGQPKTIAEYIQATSRVGRSQKAPGLVITLFNAAKSRDRSRYETFASWHRSLYRDVEATSVTPFAPRARDRALHAPYVAMVRHLVNGMENPGAIEQHQKEAEALLAKVVARIERIDPIEAETARAQLNSFLDGWFDRQGLNDYWQDYGEASDFGGSGSRTWEQGTLCRAEANSELPPFR